MRLAWSGKAFRCGLARAISSHLSTEYRVARPLSLSSCHLAPEEYQHHLALGIDAVPGRKYPMADAYRNAINSSTSLASWSSSTGLVITAAAPS